MGNTGGVMGNWKVSVAVGRRINEKGEDLTYLLAHATAKRGYAIWPKHISIDCAPHLRKLATLLETHLRFSIFCVICVGHGAVDQVAPFVSSLAQLLGEVYVYNIHGSSSTEPRKNDRIPITAWVSVDLAGEGLDVTPGRCAPLRSSRNVTSTHSDGRLMRVFKRLVLWYCPGS